MGMVCIIKYSRPISGVSASDPVHASSITEFHQSDHGSGFETWPVLQSSFAVSIFTLLRHYGSFILNSVFTLLGNKTEKCSLCL